MLIQVHDELVLETPKAHADAGAAAVVEEMQGAMPLRVPLKVDAALGPNWLEGKG
jgi:DNA polymerase I